MNSKSRQGALPSGAALIDSRSRSIWSVAQWRKYTAGLNSWSKCCRCCSGQWRCSRSLLASSLRLISSTSRDGPGQSWRSCCRSLCWKTSGMTQVWYLLALLTSPLRISALFQFLSCLGHSLGFSWAESYDLWLVAARLRLVSGTVWYCRSCHRRRTTESSSPGSALLWWRSSCAPRTCPFAHWWLPFHSVPCWQLVHLLFLRSGVPTAQK